MLDDRAQHVRVLNPAGFNDWPVQGDARIAALVRRTGVAMRGGGLPNIVWGLAQVVLTIGAAAAVALCLGRFVPGTPGWVTLAAVAAVVLICGRLLVQARTHTREPAMAEVILAEGLCPCCGYNFHGLSPESDGCYLCPECAAAWRGCRIARTVAFAAGARDGDAISAIRSGVSAGSAWTVFDEQARRVELVHPRLRRQLKSCKNRGHRERLLAARRAIMYDARWSRRIFLGVLWVFSTALVGLVTFSSTGSAGAAPILAACCFFGLPIGAAFGNFGYHPRKVRGRMLVSGLCPSCAADLTRRSADERGVRVCPACTSAWRVDRAGAAQDGLSTSLLS